MSFRILPFLRSVLEIPGSHIESSNVSSLRGEGSFHLSIRLTKEGAGDFRSLHDDGRGVSIQWDSGTGTLAFWISNIIITKQYNRNLCLDVVNNLNLRPVTFVSHAIDGEGTPWYLICKFGINIPWKDDAAVSEEFKEALQEMIVNLLVASAVDLDFFKERLHESPAGSRH